MDAGTPDTDAGTSDTNAGTPNTDANTPDTNAGTSDTDAGTSDTEGSFFSLYLESEGRISKNQISKNQKGFSPYIPYIECGLHYSRGDNLNFLISLEAESYKNIWDIGLDEFYVSYTFDLIPLSLKAGWLPLSVGYKELNDKTFSQDLSFYNIFSPSQEDVGLVAELYIWRKILSLQISRFGGWMHRKSDHSYQAPELAPFIISAHSQGSFWNIFVSWFEKDLAFFNALQAVGAGIQLNASYKKLTASIQSEFWHIAEEGQTIATYYIFPNLTIHKWQIGMTFGNINTFFPDFQQQQVTSSVYERVLQISYRVHPNVTLTGERFIGSQRKGLSTSDIWALRVKVRFDWPKDFQ